MEQTGRKNFSSLHERVMRFIAYSRMPGAAKQIEDKKSGMAAFFVFCNKVPADAVRPFILNLKVQGGH